MLEFEFDVRKTEYDKLYQFVKYAVGELYENPPVVAFNTALNTIVMILLQYTGEPYDEDVVSVLLDGEDDLTVQFRIKSEDGIAAKISLEGTVERSELGIERGVESLRYRTLEDMGILWAEFIYGPYTDALREKYEKQIDLFIEGYQYIQDNLKSMR